MAVLSFFFLLDRKKGGFMHSFSRFLLCASYELGPILNAENMVVSKTFKVPAPKELRGEASNRTNEQLQVMVSAMEGESSFTLEDRERLLCRGERQVEARRVRFSWVKTRVWESVPGKGSSLEKI